jgi:type IV secretion system protein VirB5
MITNDGVAQRKAIDRVYAHIANGSQAMGFINDFYRGDPPQKRAQTQTVSVDVQSVLPTSDRTFELEWIETTRDLQGQVKQQVRWKGAFTVTVNPPADEALMRVNPLGIYVTNASWSKVL